MTHLWNTTPHVQVFLSILVPTTSRFSNQLIMAGETLVSQLVRYLSQAVEDGALR